jgi:hypothetical protein
MKNIKHFKLIGFFVCILLNIQVVSGQKNKNELEGKYFKITFTGNSGNVSNDRVANSATLSSNVNFTNLNITNEQSHNIIFPGDTAESSGAVINSIDERINLLDNTKALLVFENGLINSSVLLSYGENGYLYHSKNVNGVINFSSNNKSNVKLIKGVWNGTVRGNYIKGSLTWTTDEGRKLVYTFKGSIASPRDKKTLLKM